MTKTLADMTPQERANCVGMWCENEDGYPCVYMGDHISRAWLGICASPRFSCTQALALGALIPRFDPPRAWTPDGTPVAGDWEYAVQYKTPDGWEYSCESWDCRWQESEAAQEVRALRDHPGEETRIVRRLVSQPEEVQP